MAIRRYVLTTASAVCIAALFAGAPAAKRLTTAAIQPQVTCIMEQPDRTYDVEFGYVNSTGSQQTISMGADNFFSPANTFNHRNPPTTFAPGTVTHAVFVSNIPDKIQLAWSVTYGGVTATVVANRDLPHCPKTGGSGGQTSQPATPPTLALSTWATVRKAHVGRRFVFGVRIRNTGSVAASGVSLRDVVSRKVSLIGLKPKSATCTRVKRLTTCTLASIPAHSALHFAFRVRGLHAGKALNLARMIVQQGPIAAAQASVRIVPRRR